MEKLGDLIDPALRRLGVHTRVREIQLRDVFDEVVGPALAGTCQAVRLDRGVLLIAVANTALGHQLHLDQIRLIGALNDRLGATAVRRLRFTTLDDTR